MKKFTISIIAIMVIAMFVLSGCGSKSVEPVKEYDEPTQEVSTQPAQKEQVQEQTTTTDNTPEPETAPEPKPARIPSKAVQKILDAHERVKSMTYMYQDSINYPAEWKTYVLGNKVRIELHDLEEISGENYIDNIYLNTATKTGKGYCESKLYRCTDPNQEQEVRYAKYARKTPLDWINEVTYAEKENTEQMQQRTTAKLIYDDENGNEVTMWVDEYYGLPMQVFVKKGSDTKKYIYEDLAINNVEDSDVEHQYINEVYRD